MGVELQNMLAQAGAGQSGAAVRSAPGAWQQSLQSGSWSMISVPNVDGSATTNLFGMDYGINVGASSQPGAVTGYLQTDSYNNYTFASGQYTSIDTHPANTPANEAAVQIGSQTYRSNVLSAGQSGFYVLALDGQLKQEQSGTYVTNTNSTANPTGVQQLANALNQLTSTPGLLVVVQSIGAPNGAGPVWDFDTPLAGDHFAKVNAPVPNDSSVWGQSSLAAAMGALGGSAAHAQIAQMVTPAFFQPAPSYAGGGYTLVASTGALQDDTASPVTRSQTGSQTAQARVTGTLQRSRQSLWTVSSSGWLGTFDPSSLAQLAYQAPTPWPDSTTSAQQQANAYLAGQLGFSGSDVREQYVQDSGSDWAAQAATLQGIDYPGAGHGFDQPTFAAVKQELHTEMLDVAQVNALFSNLKGLFVQGTQSGYIDLQAIAQAVLNSLPNTNSQAIKRRRQRARYHRREPLGRLDPAVVRRPGGDRRADGHIRDRVRPQRRHQLRRSGLAGHEPRDRQPGAARRRLRPALLSDRCQPRKDPRHSHQRLGQAQGSRP